MNRWNEVDQRRKCTSHSITKEGKDLSFEFLIQTQRQTKPVHMWKIQLSRFSF